MSQTEDMSPVLQALFEEALKLFKQRNPVYGNTWLQEGVEGNFQDVKRKFYRLEHMMENQRDNEQDLTDKLLDLANRAVMTLYLLRLRWHK